MNCEIEWNNLSLEDWEARFSSIRRANLLQSYRYAQAVCPLYHQKPRWGLIKMDGREAGLVQLMEAGLAGNLLHAVVLDRGPLWFDGFGSKTDNEAFFKKFNAEFPRRFGRRRRIIPEIEQGGALPDFGALGYRRRAAQGYQTIWLDLTQDKDTLRAQLHQKWRNTLGKAERTGMQVEWDESMENIPWLLTNYQLDKAKKGYDGPSPKLLRHLAKAFGPQNRLLTGRAILDNQAVAAILLLLHGSCATYQVGWNAEEGRKNAAHNLLLWQAVCHLKDKAITDFDLGGVNDDTAKGVKKFKQGMGGQTLTYAGHFY